MRKIMPALAALALAAAAHATPSTQIWIPSTDVQKFKTVHLNVDVYLADGGESGGARKSPQSVIGPTVGFLPFEKLQGEAGFDVIQAGSSSLDRYPLYFHGKLGTPESSVFGNDKALSTLAETSCASNLLPS